MANKLKVTVCYDNGLQPELDDKIKALMESIGCEWYAQGTDMLTGERDITFDLEID